MKNYKYYKYNLLLAFFIFSSNGNGQTIDESALSQLSPEQIKILSDAYEGNVFNSSADKNELNFDQSLVSNDSIKDANRISGEKYGYDFFSSMPTTLTPVGDLPLPNDYKVSLRDQFTIILSGSKEGIFNLSVKLDGTILFPEIGAIFVAGLSLKEVKEKLSQLIEQTYIGVKVDVSMQNLSSTLR